MILPLAARQNERGVFRAINLIEMDRPEEGRALVAVKLMGKGYPPMVAGRVALDLGRRFMVKHPSEVRP